MDTTSRMFVFSASEVYCVDNGKLLSPGRVATILGNVPDALTRVAMIGKDMKLDSGLGTCSIEAQSVPMCGG